MAIDYFAAMGGEPVFDPARALHLRPLRSARVRPHRRISRPGARFAARYAPSLRGGRRNRPSNARGREARFRGRSSPEPTAMGDRWRAQCLRDGRGMVGSRRGQGHRKDVAEGSRNAQDRAHGSRTACCSARRTHPGVRESAPRRWRDYLALDFTVARFGAFIAGGHGSDLQHRRGGRMKGRHFSVDGAASRILSRGAKSDCDAPETTPAFTRVRGSHSGPLAPSRRESLCPIADAVVPIEQSWGHAPSRWFSSVPAPGACALISAPRSPPSPSRRRADRARREIVSPRRRAR